MMAVEICTVLHRKQAPTTVAFICTVHCGLDVVHLPLQIGKLLVDPRQPEPGVHIYGQESNRIVRNKGTRCFGAMGDGGTVRFPIFRTLLNLRLRTKLVEERGNLHNVVLDVLDELAILPVLIRHQGRKGVSTGVECGGEKELQKEGPMGKNAYILDGIHRARGRPCRGH